MWKFIKRVIFIIIVFNILAVIWGRFFNPPITFIQLGGLAEYGKLDRNYIPFDEMGDNVKLAVIASEDQNYFKHNGFDFKAIERAMKHNEKKNKKTIQGGSTISQQTAKNIFLWNGRSWVRKGLEVVYTFIIEHLWNKDIILERYLNSIEMGRGVFGVEAASKYYFNKSAKDLTKSEAAWIAAVLPNPKKYDPKNPSPYLQKKHSWIMKQMGYMKLN
ncbi:monofunctional biosynthetic peptidoglycan transglycosylase [Elizabethkingia anophelis]|uniref:monofunctional biosynthetic peptidoglycan transglycosylase n=1 Tax=Elizabethkingia anophelis TaxID=1117645 RepID=UPI00293C36A9|nr:monofunctional biosynthetic peptidoglycan transglycosylase [Elizabethkingia anophelis]